MIKTTSSSQDEIIKNIMTLYKIREFTLDPCYSKGNFYKNIVQPLHCYDVAPQHSWVKQSEAFEVPLPAASCESIMFDPPFLATKGPSLGEASGNIILKRFSVFPTEGELFKFYWKSLSHFYALLQTNGILVVKCQDKVSSSKQYFSHVYIHNMAVELGFYPKDLFILINEKKMLGKWKDCAQQHANKTHSYFFVFKKEKNKVNLNRLLED